MRPLLARFLFSVSFVQTCGAFAEEGTGEGIPAGVVKTLDSKLRVTQATVLVPGESFRHPCENDVDKVCNHNFGCSIFARSGILNGMAYCSQATAAGESNYGANYPECRFQKCWPTEEPQKEDLSWLEFCVMALAILVVASSTAGTVTSAPIRTLILRALDSWGPTRRLRAFRSRHQRELDILERKYDMRVQEMQEVAAHWFIARENMDQKAMDRMRRKAISLEASLNKIINRYKHVDSQGDGVKYIWRSVRRSCSFFLMNRHLEAYTHQRVCSHDSRDDSESANVTEIDGHTSGSSISSVSELGDSVSAAATNSHWTGKRELRRTQKSCEEGIGGESSEESSTDIDSDFILLHDQGHRKVANKLRQLRSRKVSSLVRSLQEFRSKESLEETAVSSLR